MSSPTGPAEQLAGGSFPRSTSSLLILLSDIFFYKPGGISWCGIIENEEKGSGQ